MEIRHGQVGTEVEDVQRRLASLDLPCDDDPGLFGDATRAAVRTFQQRRGLVADGIVGDDTWHALVGASYRLGDRLLYATLPAMHGDDVRDLQRRLNRLGFDSGYDDGLFEGRTDAALREFQLNVGMAVDGIAGPQTIDLLARLHRQHQESPAFVVHERDLLRRERRHSIAGARVMIDPAQGIDHPGTCALDGTPGHEIAWAIATLIQGQLAALGAHVVFSRGPRTTPTPSRRAQHANVEDVEAILSIHVNADASARARGVAGHHFGTDVHVSEQGRALALLVVDSIVAATGSPHCRVHPSTAALLRESRAPAAVVEVGFVTNAEDSALLTSTTGQRDVARACVDALSAYLLTPSDDWGP
ncbi:MAG: peptidoglycan-binding protein [Nitriliruptoraceae bacterium]